MLTISCLLSTADFAKLHPPLAFSRCSKLSDCAVDNKVGSVKRNLPQGFNRRNSPHVPGHCHCNSEQLLHVPDTVPVIQLYHSDEISSVFLNCTLSFVIYRPLLAGVCTDSHFFKYCIPGVGSTCSSSTLASKNDESLCQCRHILIQTWVMLWMFLIKLWTKVRE